MMPLAGLPEHLRVIDSHTIGEPTRVVLDEALVARLDLGAGSVRERRDRFRDRVDHVRRALIGDPRGTVAMVGVILVPPADASCRFGAFYVNRVGYLDVCGHATIGLAVTLGQRGLIEPGTFRLETPAGVVGVAWHGGAEASFEGVPPRRIVKDMALTCDDGSQVTGDVATSGLWFFLCRDHGLPLEPAAIPALTARAWSIRRELESRGMPGGGGKAIDHVVLHGPPHDPANDGRAFVLCPDGAFDRSPCGTGTSALVGCLFEDGLLSEGRTWRQESVLGGVYEARIRRTDGVLVPTVRGRSWLTADTVLHFAADDPYRTGLASSTGSPAHVPG